MTLNLSSGVSWNCSFTKRIQKTNFKNFPLQNFYKLRFFTDLATGWISVLLYMHSESHVSFITVTLTTKLPVHIAKLWGPRISQKIMCKRWTKTCCFFSPHPGSLFGKFRKKKKWHFIGKVNTITCTSYITIVCSFFFKYAIIKMKKSLSQCW